MMLTQSDNNRSVGIRVGETVDVSLPENATTGYRWAIERYDDGILEALPASPHYAAPAVGSGGDVKFAFRGKAPGAGEIALKHWRHWEGDASVTERFRVSVTVAAAE
ncbi:MAG: protease inhibitor I42 family protein [Alphaproteobacteria bacterium]|nr:protease inhibitor I42 family protein [Alphaproteobacteria bacterium]